MWMKQERAGAPEAASSRYKEADSEVEEGGEVGEVNSRGESLTRLMPFFHSNINSAPFSQVDTTPTGATATGATATGATATGASAAARGASPEDTGVDTPQVDTETIGKASPEAGAKGHTFPSRVFQLH